MDAEGREVETLIEDWNASRVDIFAISKPDDNLDFSGVMRFYFQEPGAKDRKVATKCIRVNSSGTTEEVIKILVEKFHPDLKMLTMPHYSLYEVHETGTEVRKLDLDEKPLYVQLYWQQSDRDGRFLLKSEEEQMTTQSLFDPSEENFKRRLSKREKKEMKKKRRLQAKQAAAENSGNEIAKQLYDDRPTSGLTRSLSNPEAVMRKRREKKLLEKMEQYEDSEANPGGGGPLRIFAESLQPEIPYKTLLFSSHHTTEHVLMTALEKYEVPPEEMDLYCLTMVTIYPSNQSDIESAEIKERVVHIDDCPLAIASSWPENKGELRFYIKKKENMPKSKRGPVKRCKDPQSSPSAHEPSPPPVSETTFDITDVPQNEKELVSSPPVHIVDSTQSLPATLEFHESGEDAFFAVVVSEVNGTAVHFKLAPTYTLYMCCRYRLSPKFRPDFPPNKRREKVVMTAKKVANMMWQTVKENTGMAGHLAFWMANASEFLHFLKQDEDLSAMTEDSQKLLAHTTQQAFRSLVQCIKSELQGCLPAFLDPSDENDFEEGENDSMLEGGEQFDPNEGYLSTERSFRVKNFSPNGRPIGGDQWMGKRKKASRPVLGDVLHTLSSAMSLLRRCRVNAALTIQLFSQVFHYINMYLFNRLVLEPQLKLCTRTWGQRLRQRLGRIQDWAENLGLELAAECHLGRVVQAAFLLQVPKQDSMAISSHCYKLNSLQLRQLLELYEPEKDEQEIPIELIDNAVAVAENTADSLTRGEGQEVRLEEEPDLHLPFLLPEDGYSSEQIRGVPPGLREFLEPLIKPGLCRLTIQAKASGLWTVHFKPLGGPEINPPEALPAKELTKITINKGGKGMGVSIVAAKGIGQDQSGIYVKEIVEGGPAHLDGRLKPGDQILEVNGESLVGIAQDDAVGFLMKAGSMVYMVVSKGAVWQHGLTLLLKQPAAVNKVESPTRNPEPQMNLTQKKDIPKAPPRYRAQQQESAPRSPVIISHVTESEQQPSSPKHLGQPQPEPRPRRRSPYDSEYKDWKSHVQHDGGPEQANASTKTVVEYKQDEASSSPSPKVYKGPVPYANPQDIQRRQKEMQERKVAEERREQENMEREKIRREEEERQERERQEHERIKREEMARRERERKEQEREQREREQRERERIQREELEQQERRERERIDREELERKKREEREKKERERIQREEMERKQREERERREEQEKKDREERERRKFQDRRELDDMSRDERELEMKLEQKRREKEKRLQELRRQLEEEEAEAERIEREYLERKNKKREERNDQQRNPVPKDPRPPPAAANTQVHYVSDQGKGREIEENKREAWAEEGRQARRVDYVRRPQQQLQSQDSMELDPMEVERQFQQRLAQEERSNRSEEPDGNFVTVIRVPVQQDNWESPDGEFRSGDRPEDTRKRLERVEIEGGRPEADDRTRARVDRQRSGDERYRKETQVRRDQDEQLMRDFQKQRTFVEGEVQRKQPVGSGGDAMFPRQLDWEKEDELRRQREEDDRLREARANQLRNRCIEKPEEDEANRNASYNGRTKRVKFATVRTEITQPSPEIELSKAGVKFVHDGKVADSEDEDEFPRPPSPEDEQNPPPHPPPPENDVEYSHYQRPPPPPKPQYLTNPKTNGTPPEYSSHRDNEPFISAQPQSRMTEQEMRYATYPGRQPHNNNHPVPKPRVSRNSDSNKSSPDQAKLPFKDKMKVFNETTPPKKQTSSRWEREQNGNINGDTL